VSKVSYKKKDKYNLGPKEKENHIYTFWTVDEDNFIHLRNKVLIPFILSVYCWTGARIGTFFPKKKGGSRRYSVKYLSLIEHLEIILKRTGRSSWKVIYRVGQKFVKGSESPENTTYDDTQYQLALAIADSALLHIKSVQDLWQFQVPEGNDELQLLRVDSKKDLPIDMTHGVTEEEPLPVDKFNAIIKSFFLQAGYYKDVTVHCIRRNLGTAVNGTSQLNLNIQRPLASTGSITSLLPRQPDKTLLLLTND
ncbi:MAG: hypothetical protein Q9210_004441, partial [Variospora velana]